MKNYFSKLQDFILNANFDEVKANQWEVVYTKDFKVYDEWGCCGRTTILIHVFKDGDVAISKIPANGRGISKRYSWEDGGKFKIEV